MNERLQEMGILLREEFLQECADLQGRELLQEVLNVCVMCWECMRHCTFGYVCVCVCGCVVFCMCVSFLCVWIGVCFDTLLPTCSPPQNIVYVCMYACMYVVMYGCML